MAAEPSDADISMLRDICGINDVDELKVRLKANNNDINAAACDFFDGSKKFNSVKESMNWDESAFGMNRDGTEQTTQTPNPSFRIDALGDDVAHGSHSVAPSRPPSRANSRTPASNSGTIERWQQGTVAGSELWQNPSEAQGPNTPNHNFPSSAADEDADIQRAIEASRLEAGMPPQVTGVTLAPEPVPAPGPSINVNEPRFGPARRPDAEYETDQWALVPSTAQQSTQAVNIGPVASNSTAVYEETASSRIRKAGAPAFILSAGHEKMPPLASVLTILHEIPAARNALLRVGQPAPKYFHNPNWWKGAAVEYPDQEDHIEEMQEVAEELHRLMAFLDATERSYGCIDPLLSTRLLGPESDALKSFGNVIQESLAPKTLRILFSQVTQHYRVNRPTWAGEDETQEVAVVEYDPSGFSGEGFPPVQSLYDILNMVMWHQFIMNPKEEDDALACIREPGDVIVFRWQGSELRSDIEVPETIYIDRYLERNMDGALAIQEGIRAAAERLAVVKNLKEVVYMEVLPNEKKVPRVEHYGRMIERCRAKLAGIEEDAAWRAADSKWKASRERQKKGIKPTKEDLDPEKYKPRLTEEEERRKRHWEKELSLFEKTLERTHATIQKYEAIVLFFEGVHSLVTDRYTGSSSDEIKRLFAHIKKQLVGSIGEKDANRAIQYFDKLFPGVLDIEAWNDPKPTCMRMLRGVAVGDKVVYVCQRSTTLVGNEMEVKDEWWKLEYREDEADPVSAEIVDEMTVRVAAGKTKDKPILVYASEDALKTPPDSLSEALSFFVKSDNHLFRNEVASEIPTTSIGVRNEPRSIASAPSKRKYSSGSTGTMDSNATNRASCGDVRERWDAGRPDEWGNMPDQWDNTEQDWNAQSSKWGNEQDRWDSTSPFFSNEDAEADREMSIAMSSQGTPLGAVSSAVESSPRELGSASDPASAPRRRKPSDPKGDWDVEHVEHSGRSWQESDPSPPAPPPPLEMRSLDTMPLLGAGPGDRGKGPVMQMGGSRSSNVDIMSMDVHEHDD